MNTILASRAAHLLLLFFPIINFASFDCAIIDFSRQCTSHSDCKANATCSTYHSNLPGKCKCLDGYEVQHLQSDYRCSRALDVGSSCDNDVECQIFGGLDAACINNKCTCCTDCLLGEQGLCVKKLYLGEICLSDDSCRWIQNAGCVQGKCTCAPAMKPSLNKTKCLRTAYLGESCATDEECISNTMRCDSVCQCKVNYVVSRTSIECLKASSNIGDECMEDVQCTRFFDNTQCEQNKCVCKSGMHKTGNQCIKSVLPGGRCTADEECTFKNELEGYVQCLNNVCVCKLGSVEEESITSCKIGNNIAYNVHLNKFSNILIFIVPNFLGFFI